MSSASHVQRVTESVDLLVRSIFIIVLDFLTFAQAFKDILSVSCDRPPGTTVTLMLVTGSLITVANLGDSSAVLDTGNSIFELTKNHRIQDNETEKKRLEVGSSVLGCR
jgi:hypothetical protein